MTTKKYKPTKAEDNLFFIFCCTIFLLMTWFILYVLQDTWRYYKEVVIPATLYEPPDDLIFYWLRCLFMIVFTIYPYQLVGIVVRNWILDKLKKQKKK